MRADVGTEIYSVTDRETGEEYIVDDAGQIEARDDVIRRLARTVRCVTPLEDTANDDAADGTETQSDSDVVDPTSYAVSELHDEISLRELSDEQRKDMVALEQSNKDRSSVVEWLEP
jgi:hypothetical protein